MCLSIESVESRMTPRIFTEFIVVSVVPENEIFESFLYLKICFLDPNKTASVLFGLSRNPFSRNHFVAALAH